MKARYFALSVLFFASHFIQAQVGSEYHVRDIINEKVRIPEYNSFAHQSYNVHLSMQRGEISQAEGQGKLAKLRADLGVHSIELRSGYKIEDGAEPCIAINPQNPDQLAVAFMQLNDFPIFYSHDGGNTWTQSRTTTTQMWRQVNPSSGGNSLGGGDPILVYDANGILHLTYILLDFVGEGYMLYATSEDGGVTFNLAQNGTGFISKGNFFTGLGNPLDREWLASDHSIGAHRGRTYIASVFFGGDIAESGILTFSTKLGEENMVDPVLAIPDNGQLVQFTNLKVGDDGTVHLGCWMADPQSGDGHAVYSQSMDGGQSWSSPYEVGEARSKFPDPSGEKEIHSRENSAVSLASSNDNVYMAWTHQKDRQQRGFYAYSNDNGNTWSEAIEFGLEVSTDDYYHFFANVASSGDRATISWYEVDKSTLISNYKMVEIEDNGQSFGVPHTVSSQTTNFTGAGASQFKFYGDYNSSVKDGCNTYAIWSDGTQEPTIYVNKFDGCQDVSAITEITPVNANIALSAIYPNPVGAVLNLEMEVFIGREDVAFALTANDGKLIKQLSNKRLNEGKHLLEFDVDALGTGTYFIQVQMEDGVFVSRSFVKG